jgi:copper chaperone CopZ
MKTKSVMQVAMFLAMLVFGTQVMSQKAGESSVTLKANVTCQSCKNKIEKNMAYEKGVVSVDANIEADVVTIVYKTDQTNSEALSAALKKHGYDNSLEGAAVTDSSKCVKKAHCKGKYEPGCKKECCKKKSCDKKEPGAK